MRKILTKRTALIAAVAGSILITGAGLKAFADGEQGPQGDITLETMLEKVSERFDEVDTDADGLITQAEANAKMAEGSQRMLDRLTSMFDRIDGNDDGVLTADERGYNRLSARLGLEGDITLDQVQAAAEARVAERAGGDTDTYPQSRTDALADAEAKFAELDANGDGVLSGEERPDRGHRGHKGGHGNR